MRAAPEDGRAGELRSREGTDGRRRRWALRLVLGLVLFVGIVLYLVPSWSDVADRVDVSVPFVFLGLLGCAIAHLAVAARWKLLSESTGGNRLGLGTYLHGLLTTRFAGQFVPSLAMDLVGRGVVLRSAGSKRGVGHATTMVVLERIFDVVIPTCLVAWAMGVRSLGSDGAAGALLVVGTTMFVLVATPGLRPLAALAIRIYSRVGRVSSAEVPVEITTRVSLQVAVLSVVRFAGVVVQFAGIGMGVGVTLSWVEWTSATPIAQLSALVGVTPGGLGVVEAGWWAALAWVSVDRTVIALFLLAQRTALVAFLGGLALATWPLSTGSRAAGSPE